MGHLKILLTTPIFNWLVCLLIELNDYFFNPGYKFHADICIANIFLPVPNLPFHFLHVFGRREILNFEEVQICQFFLSWFTLAIPPQEIFAYLKVIPSSPIVFSQEFYSFDTFSSVAYFKSDFLYNVRQKLRFTLFFSPNIPLHQHYLLKMPSFPPLNYLGTLIENQLLRVHF